ncbi:MAG: HD domain-containing protein [Tuberibacillus sp.]
MNKDDILQAARAFVKDELGQDSSGHDDWHAYRVSELAGRIAQAEQADVFICRLTGLLHDVGEERCLFLFSKISLYITIYLKCLCLSSANCEKNIKYI